MSDENATPQIETKPTAPQFTEAPYSGNVRARILGYDWQLTIRAADSKQFLDKINGLMVWLNNNADRAVNVEPAPIDIRATAPAAPAPAPVAPSPASVMSLRIVKMTVTPRTDGKVDLKFFEAGHQYPDIYTAKTPIEAVTMLKTTGAWTPGHFAAAGEFQVSMVVDYKNSEKLNKNGKPYKDIITVSAA